MGEENKMGKMLLVYERNHAIRPATNTWNQKELYLTVPGC